jgi:prepilin-type N-terminal cleavage/methylation domain-containing protein
MISKKGFTLIELIISIAVISVLSGMAALAYTGVRARGRDAQRKNDLLQMKVALSAYYNAQSPLKYVASTSALTVTGTDALSTALSPNYIRQMPQDPLYPTTNYTYTYQSSTTIAGVADQAFSLKSTLENQKDKQGWAGGSTWTSYGYIVQND